MVAGAERGRCGALESAKKKLVERRVKMSESQARIAKLEAIERPKPRDRESPEKECRKKPPPQPEGFCPRRKDFAHTSTLASTRC